jgi:hypothetical protein
MWHVPSVFKRCGRAFRAWRKRERLRATLYGLPDRELGCTVGRGHCGDLLMGRRSHADEDAGAWMGALNTQLTNS